MYAVRSKTGAALRRNGVQFDPRAFRLLSESQMSPAIRSEKSLEIVQVTGRDDAKLALHRVLEGDPVQESPSNESEPEKSKPVSKKTGSPDAESK